MTCSNAKVSVVNVCPGPASTRLLLMMWAPDELARTLPVSRSALPPTVTLPTVGPPSVSEVNVVPAAKLLVLTERGVLLGKTRSSPGAGGVPPFQLAPVIQLASGPWPVHVR